MGGRDALAETLMAFADADLRAFAELAHDFESEAVLAAEPVLLQDTAGVVGALPGAAVDDDLPVRR